MKADPKFLIKWDVHNGRSFATVDEALDFAKHRMESGYSHPVYICQVIFVVEPTITTAVRSL
jgi:hypothetical protein